MRVRLHMRVLATVAILDCSGAHAANITSNGNCNIILNDIRDAQILIQGDCTVSGNGANEYRIPSIQGAQHCHCTTRKSFVRRLEAEIVRMCRGVCELPGYEQAHDMLNRIVRQVPVCCHRAILNDVMRANKVSCKVKLISSAWLETQKQDREEIISSAVQKFRENKIGVCNSISSDQ